MPGLINKESRGALPLSVCDITSCVRGYTLAMTASMTYENIEDHAIEGIFLYPLEENSIVVGFETMICSQIITLQIKDKTKIDDCYLDDCTTNGGLQSGSGQVMVDEDLERTVLLVHLGLIPPLETVHVLVSTSSELCTLPCGGIRVRSPPACTPRVQRSINEEQGLSPNFCRTRERSSCASSPPDQSGPPPLCLASLLEEEAINSMDYQFNFQLEIRAPYLLAGVESPSHAIRADADPQARSATSVMITLADKYTYDCPVEILIYPSEPHVPHVLIESGDITPDEYDEFLHGRSDFIKALKKDGSDLRKVEMMNRRLHKDLLHNPVVMLNFCPDLRGGQDPRGGQELRGGEEPRGGQDPRGGQGEYIFLLDRSGSMSGANISRVKDAMVLILKSLLPGCLFNIIGFGSTFKPLFPTSQSYEEENLVQASEYVRRLRGDMGGTNVLNPLIWILRQPSFRGHPRLLFLITDGAVRNTGAVIELIRSQARSIRCFTFGLGQTACRRLVLGLASVSRGTAEFLSEGERLQPKMIKSLKKTMCPVLTDISIEWLFPETKEVLLSPVGNNFLFPGDSLIGYSVVCDATRYHNNPKSDKRRRYSMMRSVESASSVFFHSQEEDPLRTGGESESFRDPLTPPEQDPGGCETSPRRRAYSTTQITDHHPIDRAFTPSDPCSVAPKNPLRRAKVQELVGQSEAQWRRDYQPQLASLCSASLCREVYPAISQRPLPDPEPQPTNHKPPSAAPNPAGGDGSRSSSDSPSVGSLGDSDGYGHQLVQAETPQEVQASDLGSADCKAVVSGLLSGRPASWEVVFDIEPFLSGREREEKVHEELWNETFHHLAGRSIIRDFENMADAESEIEHGPGRKYQLFAIHTSKSCNILSKHTAFVPIDLDTNEYLHTCIEYANAGEGLQRGSRSSSRSGSRKNRGYSVGLGRSQSGGVSEDAEDFLINNGEDGASPCSTPSSAGWERCSFTEVSQRSPSVSSDQSQKSVESLFSARLALSRTRLLTRAAKGFICRSHSKSGDSMAESDNENKDYIPLVLLQLASGAFPLDAALCFATSVPMEKLKWTSPFSSHRNSLAPQRDPEFSPPHDPPSSGSLCTEPQASLHTYASLPSQTDSVRGSVSTSSPRRLDPESLIWGTAVALAWLEHSSASHFIEWELAAAKASTWLSAQEIPERRDLESVKAAANQLFIILRHWDENLQLNMLCYHPSSV